MNPDPPSYLSFGLLDAGPPRGRCGNRGEKKKGKAVEGQKTTATQAELDRFEADRWSAGSREPYQLVQPSRPAPPRAIVAYSSSCTCMYQLRTATYRLWTNRLISTVPSRRAGVALELSPLQHCYRGNEGYCSCCRSASLQRTQYDYHGKGMAKSKRAQSDGSWSPSAAGTSAKRHPRAAQSQPNASRASHKRR